MDNPKKFRNQRVLKIVKTVDSKGRESIQISDSIMDFSIEELSVIINQLEIFTQHACHQRVALMNEYNTKKLKTEEIE